MVNAGSVIAVVDVVVVVVSAFFITATTYVLVS